MFPAIMKLLLALALRYFIDASDNFVVGKRDVSRRRLRDLHVRMRVVYSAFQRMCLPAENLDLSQWLRVLVKECRKTVDIGVTSIGPLSMPTG